MIALLILWHSIDKTASCVNSCSEIIKSVCGKRLPIGLVTCLTQIFIHVFVCYRLEWIYIYIVYVCACLLARVCAWFAYNMFYTLDLLFHLLDVFSFVVVSVHICRCYLCNVDWCLLRLLIWDSHSSVIC